MSYTAQISNNQSSDFTWDGTKIAYGCNEIAPVLLD